jgi:large subunit ribosomal protein L17
MRHRVAHRKLGRVTEHRIALLRHQAHALLLHERIETTMPKAKELRPFVERIITTAKRGLAAEEPNGRTLHARRLVLQDIPDRAVVGKLFDAIAPRFAARPGGYTRILRLGYRQGDSAELARIELVGSEYNPAAEAEKEQRKKEAARTARKGMGGRLRAAAARFRGRKAAQEQPDQPRSRSEDRSAGRARKKSGAEEPSE